MRIVIKVGTHTITHSTGQLNVRQIENLCKVISDIKNMGHEIIIVSSGAIGMGVGKLKLVERPSDIPTKQACAAVGQCELMYTYDKLFLNYNHTVAQVLLTAEDVKDKKRSTNFHNTINRLLQLDIIPIINENDTISVDEISIGDNDTLSAIVAMDVDADLLILLSDIDGLYDSDPNTNDDALVIHIVKKVTPHIMAMAGGKGSKLSVGGMKTKLNAAKMVNKAGMDMVILNGSRADNLYDLLEGKPVGTIFLGERQWK